MRVWSWSVQVCAYKNGRLVDHFSNQLLRGRQLTGRRRPACLLGSTQAGMSKEGDLFSHKTVNNSSELGFLEQNSVQFSMVLAWA